MYVKVDRSAKRAPHALMLALCASMVIALLMMLGGGKAWAAAVDEGTNVATELQGATPAAHTLNEASSSFSLTKYKAILRSYSSSVVIRTKGYSGWYSPSVSVSNSNVVSVSTSYLSSGQYSITLTKNGVGKATVTVSDGDGHSKKIKVTSKPTAFKLNYSKFTFSKKTRYYSSLYIDKKYESNVTTDSNVKKARSSKPRVASVKVKGSGSYKYVTVTPKHAGTTKITVSDQYGQKKSVKVTVKKKYFKANLKASTSAYMYYGKNRVYVYSKPKAKVVVRIGGHRYTKRANKSGYASFKVEGDYKLDKKFKVTAKTKHGKVTKTCKVTSNTGAYVAGTLYSYSYSINVTGYNVHKGDRIIVKARGESYSHKVLSTEDTYYDTFDMKHSLRNYSRFTVIVKNKYNQTLNKAERTVRW